MKYAPLATLTFISIFLAAGEMYPQSDTALDDSESVTVYPSIEVVVNKAIVVRLPRKATKVALTQPQIAEVVVVAPDQLLIKSIVNGRGKCNPHRCSISEALASSHLRRCRTTSDRQLRDMHAKADEIHQRKV